MFTYLLLLPMKIKYNNIKPRAHFCILLSCIIFTYFVFSITINRSSHALVGLAHGVVLYSLLKNYIGRTYKYRKKIKLITDKTLLAVILIYYGFIYFAIYDVTDWVKRKPRFSEREFIKRPDV